ncbi:MAG: glycosyltransferase family 4 protein [Patescibacteria group bacterium]|jgi:glycosyltransferase involved in cell wall biosynthesis|nr:glycosyltransferase family 4 protein [Patescibacteria group bacterium]
MIYFFTKGSEDVPSSRRRIFYLAKYLENFGYQSKIFVPTHRPWWNLSIERFKEAIQNIKILSGLKKEDTLYLHRPVYQLDFIIIVIFFRLILRKKYIFDFDDPIFLHSPVKTYILTKLATSVVVGGHFLYDYAVKINKNTKIIPMLVDTENTEAIKNDFEEKPIYNIGWIGDGKIHFRNLEIIKPVIEGLLTQNIDFKLILIGAKGHRPVYELFNIPGLKKEIIDWLKPEEVGDQLVRFDVALTPLIQSQWEEGKCPLKTYEYMQHGIPTIVSNVGEAKHFIKNGQNGFLAADTQDWIKEITEIIRDRKLAQTISANSLSTIKQNFSYQSHLQSYQEIFSAKN